MSLDKLEYEYNLITIDDSSLEEKIVYLKYLATISPPSKIANIKETIKELETKLKKES